MFQSTEEILKKETNIDVTIPGGQDSSQNESEVSSVLSAYKSEGDPKIYETVYQDLKNFVESSLDVYKHELGMILYPVFVHMYLELVYNNHGEAAIQFMNHFKPQMEDHYQDDLRKLSYVTKRDQMKGNELTDTFK